MTDIVYPKYSNIDFSNHYLSKGGVFIDHNFYKGEQAFSVASSIASLKVEGTVHDWITYITTNGILIVTGDYGNWIFNKPLNPQTFGQPLSMMYAVEKCKNSSEQEPLEFDPEATEKAIREELVKLEKGELWHDDEQTQNEYKDYLETCLLCLNDKFEYIKAAYYGCPSFVDTEDVIFCDQAVNHFKVIVDGFNEINRRCKLESQS